MLCGVPLSAILDRRRASKKNALAALTGLADTAALLDTAQIIAHHRPVAFVLENVKNPESHDKAAPCDHYERADQ